MYSRSAAWTVAGVLEENPGSGCHHQVVEQGQPEVDVDAIQTGLKKVVVHPRSTLTQWPFHSRYKAEISPQWKPIHSPFLCSHIHVI